MRNPERRPCDLLPDVLARAGPRRVLDVGCGCGSFTRSLTAYSQSITAIDSAPSMISKWMEQAQLPGIEYCCMDARAMGFRDEAFDFVVERATLHHIADWKTAVEAMLRVSSHFVYFEEPVDDLRSKEKENALRAQRLFLELQRDVGYPHFPHLAAKDLLDHLDSRAIVVQSLLHRNDSAIEFDEYFSSFPAFAERSPRKAYWLRRLKDLRRDLGSEGLCRDDVLCVLIQIQTPEEDTLRTQLEAGTDS